MLVAALAIGGGVIAVGVPAAFAYGPSYCNASSCMLSGGPTPGYAYFEMPRGTAVTMRCWTDSAWWNGTNRWFYVDTTYGRNWMNANQVSNQSGVGHF
jgi:hypothetical protein